ncbi:24271_t:CDS:2, partial [Dentiscutata erythropus]
DIEKKRKRTRADEVPEGEKKGVIICRYCPQSFTRRNCYQNHLTNHKNISVRERTSLSSIFYSNANEADRNHRTSKTSNYKNETSEINLEHVQQD